MFKGAIAWNSLKNKGITAKPWKNLNAVLQNLTPDNVNFEPILAATKNIHIGYKYS